MVSVSHYPLKFQRMTYVPHFGIFLLFLGAFHISLRVTIYNPFSDNDPFAFPLTRMWSERLKPYLLEDERVQNGPAPHAGDPEQVVEVVEEQGGGESDEHHGGGQERSFPRAGVVALYVCDEHPGKYII